MNKLIVAILFLCVAGVAFGCAPETQTVTMSAGEANKTATNAPENPQQGMEFFRNKIDQSPAIKALIKEVTLQPNSAMLEIKVYPNAWDSFSSDEKKKLGKDFQDIWALSNSPVDPNKCPVRIINTAGEAIGGSNLPNASDIWVQ
ncbi:MAG TPA: hypothetical protein VGB77_15270 [Abditibacteriaceae bacterium]|jgi:hypothetical protein